ncbi:hypothetical protein SPL90_08635 [Enterobacter hormaechei subsp. xiangfangensis]|uniref:tail fiber/spike domain-containing protein n=2 Tax=Enterobacter hormaechei TaxID=158836 RepID=UPI0007916A7B|nr:hypothetical protein [Enterobacter hormaechei]EJD0359194.1 hypothetical protein [Enterobacter hormaechei]EJM7579732.1 hypothetical protein [Enterobacter hormaechei]EJV4373295.1 hypothetical protein [Enterobacter hormaechei]EKE3051642.1 hypothetical protein [Enterobacter hormaechei]EKE3888461.1 hypothetical protein [Enterobacter hormaechei]
MATQPTQDAVPSESPRDLKFNAGKIDEFVTSMGWTYTDRFGQKHYTIEGINYLSQQAMAAYGYVILTGKTFTTGATINNPNEVLLNTADGEYYKWTGSFASGPKVVPANSTPASTGGIAPGAWIGVGDASLRAALAAVSGAGLVGVSVGSVYPAGTVGSAIQYRTPQMYGIEPSTTNIIGSGLDAMFAAGGDIRFEKPGTYLTDRAWVLRSGTRLWIGAGVILKAVDSYNGNILQNYSYAVNAGAGTADDFIEVWGPGTIDFNGLAKGFNGTGSMASVFKNVTTLRIGGGILVRNARKYCWLIAKIQNLHVDGLRFNTISDGLHLQNPCQNVYIRNLSGITGDDMFAMTIGDYPSYDISEAGDFSNVDVAGLYSLSGVNDEGTSTTTLVTCGGNGSGNFVRIKIAGLYGNTRDSVMRCNADTNGLDYTHVNFLHVSDVYAIPGNGLSGTGAFPVFTFDDRGYKKPENTYGVELDDVVLENIFSRKDTAPVVNVSGSVGTAVHQLTINNGPRNGLGIVSVNNANTTVIDTLIINDCRIIMPVNANAAVVNTRGVIGQVFMTNVQAISSGITQGRLYRAIGTTSLSKMHLTNITQTNGLAAIFAQAAMATQPEIYLTNCTFDGSAGVIDLTGTTAKIYCRNVKAPMASGFVPFSSNAAGYTLSGDVDTDGSNTLATSNSGTIRLMRGLHNIACDLTKLTSVDNSGCYNSNASLSCGIGMVTVQSKVWKHMYTAATYTSSI